MRLGMARDLVYYLAMHMLLACVYLNAESAEIRDGILPFDRHNASEIRLYGIGIEMIPLGRTPEEIRKDPTYYIRGREAGHGLTGPLNDLLDWLELDKLRTYSLGDTKETYRVAAGMLFVVDVKFKDGSTKTFYGSINSVYDDSLSYRRLYSCEFMKHYLQLVNFGRLTSFDEGQLALCKQHHADPNFRGEVNLKTE